MNQTVIGVVGLGTMGIGIAQVFAQAGFTVLATDAGPAARAAATARIQAALQARITLGRLTQTEADATMARLIVADDPAGLAPADLVIEAIIEDLAAKHALFAALAPALSHDCILATNTSSLSVAAVASGVADPARVIGLHFFNPAPAMQLVELVAHSGTDPAAISFARRITEQAGKQVILAPDRPGFIVNRCARPFYGEALALLEEGRSAADIDAAMLAAGYRIGPLSLIDLIGADINLAASEGLASAMQGHPRHHVFHRLRAQVASGHLGRKTGQGFVFPALPGPPPPDAAAIVLRIEAVLANEAASLLAEGATEADIDRAMQLGLNFPRGPFAAARQHGLTRIRSMLFQLEDAAPVHLKGRYRVTSSLADLQ